MTSALTKMANVAQKTAVVGLLGMFGYHTYQISRNVVAGLTKHDTMDSTYFEDVQKKVDEEYQTKYGRTDKRDWYDKEDQSYLKDVPRGVKPKAGKE
ncbi:expressed unknown protein [Seminavis robusta]|uniref:Uncharacterized protein n=1 Tax=Seminavis robusta TaxID=568900 RepID=A0A9N8HRE3_9STRA|nr:expressed unknown protein [Seminavis robusta]|eukprot:Sro1310_g261640.1 n/a (97) ;mRNA; r:15768-16058